MTESSTKGLFAHRIRSTRPSALRQLRMHAQSLKAQGKDVLDLASGNPEHDPPKELRDTFSYFDDASFAYGDPRGLPKLRHSVAEYIASTQNHNYDPDSEITIVSGATGGLSAALVGLVDPGVGIAMFTPFYESLAGIAQLVEARTKFVPLRGPRFSFSERHLEVALSGYVRFLLLNNPHNPTGRVFTENELAKIAAICIEKNITVISDEAYEAFWFTRAPRSIASFPGMKERTIVIHSWSKALNAPGLKVGSVCAPPSLTAAIRQAADLMSGAPSTNVQMAFADSMWFWQNCYAKEERNLLRARRDELKQALTTFGFTVAPAQGTSCLWADTSAFSLSDTQMSEFLLEKTGILAVPGSAFYPDNCLAGKDSPRFLRFCFSRLRPTMDDACRRLSNCTRPDWAQNEPS